MSASDHKSTSRPSLGSFFSGKKPQVIQDVSETSLTTDTFPDILAVFEKKSDPKPPMINDVSETSVTRDAFPDLLAFEKKSDQKPPTGDEESQPRVRQTTAPRERRKRLDPWEWHTKLSNSETKRRLQVETQIQQHTVQYLAVKQLVADASQETAMAYRWTKSISEIQDQVAKTLVLKEAMDDVVEDETANLPIKQSNAPKDKEAHCEELPEKLKKEADDDDEQTENSIAGSWVEGAVHEVAVVVTQSAVATPPPKKSLRLLAGGHPAHAPSRCNDGSQPPVFAISFPNPKVSMEAYFILYKQHELLQQTFSRNGVTTMSIEKIQQMKELCLENDTKLEELAGTIVHDWKDKEEAIHKLWDAYATCADEVLSAVPKTTTAGSWPKVSETDLVHKSKPTLGDVWMAEITYRNAVKHQELELMEQGPTLQSLCEMVKDGERQRRLRLRKHLQMDVLQKHAAIFQRVQLAHAEALENYFRPNAIVDTDGLAFTEEFKYNENDMEDEYESQDVGGSGKVLEKKKSKNTNNAPVEIKKPSVQEQIQHIATFIGATAVWDQDDTLEKYVGSSTRGSAIPIPTKETEIQDENCGVDVDFYLGESSDDEDLPLLQDAVVSEKIQTKMPAEKKSGRKKRKSSKKTKAAADKNAVDEKFKVNSVVVLDQESVKHAYFMDRLLYTGSLLESHYVQFATVVHFDDHPLPYSVGNNESKEMYEDNDKPSESSKHALVVITSDENLLMFDIPKSSTAIANDISNIMANKSASVYDEVTVMPGCPPSEAMRSLLIHNVKADRIMKEQAVTALSSEKVVNPPPSPSKLSFLRSKVAKEESITKEEPKCFQFNNISPSLSLALADCNVRKNMGSEISVRISQKSQNSRTSGWRLTFASSVDQDAFLMASNNNNPLWDVN